jgi:hypothetical protein
VRVQPAEQHHARHAAAVDGPFEPFRDRIFREHAGQRWQGRTERARTPRRRARRHARAPRRHRRRPRGRGQWPVRRAMAGEVSLDLTDRGITDLTAGRVSLGSPSGSRRPPTGWGSPRSSARSWSASPFQAGPTCGGRRSPGSPCRPATRPALLRGHRSRHGPRLAGDIALVAIHAGVADRGGRQAGRRVARRVWAGSGSEGGTHRRADEHRG